MDVTDKTNDKSNLELDAVVPTSVPTSGAELGTRIREIAEEIGGVRALASKSGVSENTIHGYIKGMFKPRKHRLGLLAKAVGVNEEWLTSGRGSKLPVQTVGGGMGLSGEVKAKEKEGPYNQGLEHRASYLFPALTVDEIAIVEGVMAWLKGSQRSALMEIALGALTEALSQAATHAKQKSGPSEPDQKEKIS